MSASQIFCFYAGGSAQSVFSGGPSDSSFSCGLLAGLDAPFVIDGHSSHRPHMGSRYSEGHVELHSSIPSTEAQPSSFDYSSPSTSQYVDPPLASYDFLSQQSLKSGSPVNDMFSDADASIPLPFMPPGANPLDYLSRGMLCSLKFY